ncbi:Lrp/AsnC family transcriptional regulator [Aneurinibacillus aneurinilyticus]|uniref:Transcriptional regulator, AsnC family n=1 Tax=Aneurinibacillus aneurinilyticus ATCC 12856 TaxID=649747 RepID=U1WXS9_ANEAE|nr:Lrp/AsnC family transcriptional regulator [Aneurinibacillus aneurinilyticus]ERI07058.1 transcriptional regulator, AsnC family [Aneurinibacillus aneurinilyticus ATCC 12856]MED0706404.1 Lrp/AsnC family transcriptional regulator [Aneurinibacillus aneurinilyticus]MED0723678.1 Lrp/AsnC family transcriptional regulator [Aneurinibacillus aneurinilyticus]MED0730640.1 Lrp/AsnC family transcriptional regulator [Aneurinibacillus aneurinilyticus]MED0741030.1 Lrp/AsnC family transcriptional regulator [A
MRVERDKQWELLHILEENSRRSAETIATMLDTTVEDVKETIAKLESEKTIIKYPAIVNWEKVHANDLVTAMIDVKVTPKREVGFDDVAERIYRFPEVQSVYLMSGAYDLSVVIEGKTMRQVAQFVSEKLSALDSVISTTTHFILKKYKHDGVILEQPEDDKRMVVTP